MSRRIAFLAVAGLGGLIILLSLGVWQVQRLEWKQDVIAQLDARASGDPRALPTIFDRQEDRYRPVAIEGVLIEPAIKVLASRRTLGAVFRIVRPIQTTDGRRVLVDLGWIPDGTAVPPAPESSVKLVGNLHWPRETDRFTPEPDREGGLWFARDVDDMAQHLSTEPVLIVLRDTPARDLGVTPWPADSSDVPNDHLQYAITWFSLALIWAAMSLYALRRKAKSL